MIVASVAAVVKLSKPDEVVVAEDALLELAAAGAVGSCQSFVVVAEPWQDFAEVDIELASATDWLPFENVVVAFVVETVDGTAAAASLDQNDSRSVEKEPIVVERDFAS